MRPGLGSLGFDMKHVCPVCYAPLDVLADFLDKRYSEDTLAGPQDAMTVLPYCGLSSLIGDAIQEIQALRGQNENHS